ncbi:ribosomal protein S18 [Biscogniauxia mediterranea]|nr:ribosomal protein S18 [Biscogniauxia mediterranea]
MSARIPLLAAIRRPAALLQAPSAAALSTTPSSQAGGLRQDSATSSILNLGSLDDDNGASSSSASPRAPTDSTGSVFGLYDQIQRARRAEAAGAGAGAGGAFPRGTADSRDRVKEELRALNRSDDYARQMSRRWRVGDVYTPRDIGPGEMSKWRRSSPRKTDLVDMLGLHPLDMYKNFSVISEFMTPHGRIRKSLDTGLRPPNQRKMAKAIRRAIGLGLHPSVHRHPELLERTAERKLEQNQATMNRQLKW